MRQCSRGARQRFVLLKARHILCMLRTHMWCKADCNAVRFHNLDSTYMLSKNGLKVGVLIR